jgi:hypothetical protein
LWAGEAKKERFTNIAFGRCWYACGFMAANWVLSCHGGSLWFLYGSTLWCFLSYRAAFLVLRTKSWIFG